SLGSTPAAPAPAALPGAVLAPAVAGCWSMVPSPNIAGQNNTLRGLSVVAANDIWAVGISFQTGGFYDTLTEHWDGTQWTIVPSPNPGTQLNLLYGVSAVSSSDVWAVGYYNSLVQE